MCASAKWNQRVNGLFTKSRHSDKDKKSQQVHLGPLSVIIINSKCDSRQLKCTVPCALGRLSFSNRFILNNYVTRQGDGG